MTIIEDPSDADALSKLVEISLAQNKLSGLSTMIGAIADSIDSPIAILWQVAPRPVSKTLFILAEWFKAPTDIPTYFHRLPHDLAETTWKAINSKTHVAKNKLEQSDDSEFFGDFGVKSLLSIPLVTKINAHNNAEFALNFYWTTENKLTKDESDRSIKRAQFLASLLLDLYESLKDKVSYSLLSKTSKLLSELTIKNETLSDNNSITTKICKLISDTLQAQEVSLYLTGEPRSNDPIFKLQGITESDTDILQERRIDEYNSFTGWVLKYQKSIMIFDLSTYSDYEEQYKKLYEGLIIEQGKEKVRVENMRTMLKIDVDHDLPPLSFIATPILHGDKILGVIRCCTAKKAPYYFSKQEAKLLAIVANQIAPAWDNLLNRRNIAEENKSLESFVKSLAELNDWVLDRIRNNKRTKSINFLKDLQNEIFTESLSRVHNMNNVEISAIRLVDKKNNCLYFAKLLGKVKIETTPTETFDLDHVDENNEYVKAGVWVVKNKKTLVITNKSDKYGHVLTRFKSKSMIIAPIRLGDEVVGVIDVRNPTDELFAPYTQPIVELIAMQLGLYKYLIDTVSNLRREKKQQTQIYEDFGHQLKSPMNQLRARVCGYVDECNNSSHVPKQLLYIRGLSSKALRVTQSIRLFAELSKGKEIGLQKSRLTEELLNKILIEGAMDQENTIDPSKNLKFHVSKGDSGSLLRVKLYVDIDLLIQAISNLLDNAAKYSFKNTTVEIYFGLTGKKNFHISIKSEGLSLHEAEDCKLRNWRGDDAKIVIGEGSGIGLWIVDNVMKAHGGNLIVIPTKKQVTEVKLIFSATLLY